jgi:CRISPR-associated protein Csb2
LPPPSHVIASATSGLTGAVAAFPHRRQPGWQRWQLPPKLAGRYLTHATISFDRPIQGPVILGAGRYVGLGLCLPFGLEANQ